MTRLLEKLRFGLTLFSIAANAYVLPQSESRLSYLFEAYQQVPYSPFQLWRLRCPRT
jgi:hypothetical protein